MDSIVHHVPAQLSAQTNVSLVKSRTDAEASLWFVAAQPLARIVGMLACAGTSGGSGDPHHFTP
jgi:hypothetical protein